MSAENRSRKNMTLIRRLFLLWIIYMVICLAVPPLFHKSCTAAEESAAAAEGAGGAKERIRSIDDNMDALLWRLRLIEEAQEQITLCTFDFRDDGSGGDVMAALFNAAERGVDVRIMVDGINGAVSYAGSRNFKALAGHENVQLKLYNPVNLLLPWRNNYRMHNKYLIVDGFAYILGGRNTNDLFLGNDLDFCNEDRDILVYETVPGQGASYMQLQAYAEQIWDLPCVKSRRGRAHGREALEERYQEVMKKYPEVYTEIDWEKETMETKGIELCANSMEPENKKPLLWRRVLEILGQEEAILMQTPYIICDRELYRDLTQLSSRGVEIITNAVESGANPFGCTDYLNQKEKISATGVHTYEYLSDHALHTKTILAGDDISIVGSCNLDIRSIYLDTEMMLIIESEDLNRQLRGQAEELKSLSRHVYPDGTVADGENYISAEPGMAKRFFYGVLRVLIVPIRHLL